MGQELFVVTDLSQVWVIGDLYEQDFQTVHVGSEAALTTPAYPTLTWRGRVTYIDPRVDPQTRTAKVRVEVSNAEGRLRLGMYVTLAFTTPGGERTVVIPQRCADYRRASGRLCPRPGRGREVSRTPRADRPVAWRPRHHSQRGAAWGAVVTEGSFFAGGNAPQRPCRFVRRMLVLIFSMGDC